MSTSLSAISSNFLEIKRGLTAFAVLMAIATLWSTMTFAQGVLPIADAGRDRLYLQGETIQLNGSGSQSPLGEKLRYQWSISTRPDGSIAEIVRPNAPQPSFTPDIDGDYVLELVTQSNSGVYSNADQVLLSTGNVPPIAEAGAIQKVLVGATAFVDPAGTIDANGDKLTADWSVSSAPVGSTAMLSKVSGGRYAITPDIVGMYEIELTVTDGDGATSTDITHIVAVDGINAATSNISPVANAGVDKLVVIGQHYILDATNSSDADGDLLSYEWQILYKPETSLLELTALPKPLVNIAVDVVGTYIFQVSITDIHGAVSLDTVLFSTNPINPRAVSGGPEANTDGLIASNLADVDGGESVASLGNTSDLIFGWSVLVLDAGSNTIEDPIAVNTQLDFTTNQDGAFSDPDDVAAIRLLSAYNVLTLHDLRSHSWVQGKAFIGGDLKGRWSQFAKRETSEDEFDAVSVVDNVYGRNIRIRNGGNLRVGGGSNGHVRFPEGGSTIFDPSLEINEKRAQLEQFSLNLKDVEANSDWEIIRTHHGYRRHGHKKKAVLTASPDDNGIAIFDISNGSTIFRNKQVQSIELNANGAETIIINVGGNNSYISKTMIGDFLSPDIKSKVLWNFYETHQMTISKVFEGSLLMPCANLHLRARLNGSVVAYQVQQFAPINLPIFDGSALVSGAVKSTEYALVQLEVRDQVNTQLSPSYSTTVLTTGNLRPVARINRSGDVVTLQNIEVQLSGAGSTDGDNDALGYHWAVLLKPDNSQVAFTGAGSKIAKLTPDAPGTYIVQLVVADGKLLSRPVTLAFDVENSPPTANAGDDQDVNKGKLVSLDGTSSSDPNGDNITYLWTFVGKPAGSVATLSSSTSETPNFQADVGGDYVLSLVVNDGFANSESDSVSVTALNRVPVAKIGGPVDAIAGELISLTGVNSIDPDGDELTYMWSMQKPGGSSAALSSLTNIAPAFTPDTAGVYIVSLIVSDGEDFSVAVSQSINIIGANRPPALGDIGNKTVDLGSKIQFAVQATDPDGDPLSYFVSPLPLPTGASFNVNTGEFSFRPVTDEPESFSVSFSASDGELLDRETILVSVNTNTSATTEYTGRVVDGITRLPLSGVVVKVGDQSTTTNASGVFLVTNIPVGLVLVCVEPNGTSYGSSIYTTKLINNVVNQADDIKLMPLLVSGNVVPGSTTTVSDASFGVTLEIPANGFNGSDENPYEGTIGLAALTAEQASVLPSNIVPCQLFTIEPKAVKSNKPIKISVKNYDNLPAGAVVDVWVHKNGQFAIAGSGIVTSNRNKVEANLTSIEGGQMITFVPRAGVVTVQANQANGNFVSSILNEGNFSTTYSTPSYTSHGIDRSIALVYNSTFASPDPVITGTTSFPTNSGLPETVTPIVKIGDSVVTLTSVTDLSSPADPDSVLSPNGGGKIVQTAAFNASQIPSGTYPAKFMTLSQYGCSSVASEAETRISFNNQKDSSIGTGWSIAEISNLQIGTNGTVTLVGGNGPMLEFNPEQQLGEVRETFIAEVAGDAAAIVNDIDDNGTKDVVVIDEGRGTLRFFINQDGTNFIEDTANELSVAALVTVPPRPAGFQTDGTTLRSADFNGDGVLEFVVSSDSRDAIQIISRVGTRYEITQSITTTDRITASQVEDINDDGFEDIITSAGGNLRFYLNDTNGGFNAPITHYRTGRDIDVGDIDGDGNQDVVVFIFDRAYLRFSDGDLNVTEVVVYLGNSANAFFGQLVQIGDADLDGDNDLLLATVPNPTYLENLGNREFREVVLPRPDGFSSIDNITFADVTGDGLLDAIAGERTPQPRFALFKKLKGGDFAPAEAALIGHPIGESVVADVDQDGIQDLIAKSRTNLYVDFGQAPGSGKFSSPFGDFTNFVKNEDGTYSRTFTNGTVVNYNAEGLQTSTTDRNGNATIYVYDIEGRVETITDPSGQVTTLTYGAGGLLETITDPADRVTTFVHDGDGNIIEVRNPEDQSVRYDYDEQQRMTSETNERDFAIVNSYGPAGRYMGSEYADGSSIALSIALTVGLPDLGSDTSQYVLPEDRITTITDGRGNVTETEVNEYGAPIRIVDAIGRETIFERNDNNLVAAIIKPSGVAPAGNLRAAAGTIRTEFIYDNRGNVISQKEAVGTLQERETLTEYESKFSRPIKVTDPDGFETIMEYDEFGNRTRIVDPFGNEELWAYNDQGLILSATDKNGNVTTFEYDNLSRLAFIDDASGIRQRIVRDDAGNIVEKIDNVDGPLERRMTMAYDSLNRQISETAADGGVTQYAYDGVDNLISVTDPTGIVETRLYDKRDRLITVNDPATGATILAYDEDSNLIRMTDAAGETTQFTYDEVDRMLSSIDADGKLRRFDYDVRDNITGVTDARSNVTSIGYDVLDRPISRTNPRGETWQFSYDARDNRVTSTKPDGAVISSTYDALSRMTSLSSTVGVSGLGAVSRSYTYDAGDNLLAANDNLDGVDGAQLGFTYDQENRVLTAKVSNLFGASTANNTFTYAYDNLDRRATVADSFSGTTAYTYDLVDRLTVLTAPSGNVFKSNYDLAGRLLGRVAPNVTDLMRSYDEITGRLTSQTHSGNARFFGGFDYDYSERGNITSITETGDTEVDKTYSYDALERLTEVSMPAAPGDPDLSEDYELDAEGNRISSHRSDSHVTDSANRLMSDDNYTYGYDLNGNLTTKTPQAGTSLPAWAYAYDGLDQLMRVSKAGTIVETYRYDAFGRRSVIETANDNGGFDKLAVLNEGSDRTLDIAEVGAAGAGAGNVVPLRRYTHSDNIDEPLELENFDAGGAVVGTYAYHTDHLGSVRYLTDSAGEIANAYTYDSYGVPQASTTALDQPFSYTGREWDQAAELYHYRARGYDPTTARFLQEDPIWFAAGDLNIYNYVLNNPVNKNDPTGLLVESALVAGDRAGSLQSSVQPLADGISCIYAGIASGFEVIDEVQSNGGQLVDVSVDFNTCAAAAISRTAPHLSENPLTDTGEIARNQLFQVALVTFLKGALPHRSFSTSLHPSATPAYPSTWRGK